MKASSAVGCVYCGKPCALVGDTIPEDVTCLWCRAHAAPGAFALFAPKLAEVGPLVCEVVYCLRHFGFALTYLHHGEFRFLQRDLKDAEMAP